MSYKDSINHIKEIDYSKYQKISSNEKLLAYTAVFLEENNIPLSFNYLCVAAYKFFPDKFCLDDEFREYPSADRLNRTLLHMHTSKTGNNYLTGDARLGFKLTALGRMIGNQVKSEIENNKIRDVDKPSIDNHKKGYTQLYKNFINSTIYKKYIDSRNVSLNDLWVYYHAIPYTKIDTIKKDFAEIVTYAKSVGDKDCIDCIALLKKQL